MNIEQLKKMVHTVETAEGYINNAEKCINKIKDSGTRREFSTGAVRDMATGKGRFDVIPLDLLAEITNDDFFKFLHAGRYMQAFRSVWFDYYGESYEALLDLAKHFENGLLKYGRDNWKKGIPVDSYIDSACRHYCKARAGWNDEPHIIACLWNLFCLMWTVKNIEPEQKSGKCEKCLYYSNNPESEWYLKCCLDRCAFNERGTE